jgi:hypothetical protein
VWNWRERHAGNAALSLARRSRRTGAIQALVGIAAGAALLAFGHTKLGAVAWALASFVGGAALISPLGAYARIRRGLEILGVAIGTALTWALMVPLFCLFFLPFGLLFRRGRRDPMEREFPPSDRSCWRIRPEGAGGASAYERQF